MSARPMENWGRPGRPKQGIQEEITVALQLSRASGGPGPQPLCKALSPRVRVPIWGSVWSLWWWGSGVRGWATWLRNGSYGKKEKNLAPKGN